MSDCYEYNKPHKIRIKMHRYTIKRCNDWLLSVGHFWSVRLYLSCLAQVPQHSTHKKKRHFYCSHISHRGGAAERPENTLSAFENALACQTNMFELDVHLSKDKKVVVVHDDDLKRVTDIEGHVSDYNYRDLPNLKDLIEVTFSKDLVYKNEDNKKEHFPLLEEVFINFPDVPINIDLKDNDDDLIVETVKLVERYKREKTVVWGNNNAAVIDKLYGKNPDVSVFFSMKRGVLLLFWFYTGLLPFMPLKESFFEVPLFAMFRKTRMELKGVRKTLLSVFDFISTSTVLIAHLKARGIPTYFWVLNDEEDFKKAFELGAEGVMTDCPSKLRAWLEENPQYDIMKQRVDSSHKEDTSKHYPMKPTQ